MAITLGSVTLIVQEIVSVQRRFRVKHEIPGRNNSLTQDMGLESKSWRISCTFVDANRTTDKNTLKEYFENDVEVPFLDDEGNNYYVKISEFEASQPPWGTRWSIRMVLIEV